MDTLDRNGTSPTLVTTFENLYSPMMNESNTTNTTGTWNLSGDLDDVCFFENRASMKLHVLYFIILPILILVNGLLLAAIASNWSMLRQNAVYSYLISCILSGIVSCLWTTFEVLYTQLHLDRHILNDSPLQRFDVYNPSHRSVMQSWAYRKNLVVALILVMEFNILALIYGVSDNTHFVGRYSDSSIQTLPSITKRLSQNLTQLKCIKVKKAKFVILCSLAWLLPLLLNTPTAFGWNCVMYCQCLPAFRAINTCVADDAASCSKLWLPMAGSFATTLSILYINGLVLISAMLVRIIYRFYKVSAPRKSKFSASKKKKVGKINAHGRRDSKGGLKQAVSKDTKLNSGVQDCEMDTTSRIPGNDQVKPRSCSTLPRSSVRPPLHNNIKLLIAMAGLHFVTTAPLLSVILYDVTSPSSASLPDSVLISVASLTYVYVAVLPFILLIFMGTLRKAAAKTLMKCPCFSTTFVINNEATAGAVSVARGGNEAELSQNDAYHNSHRVPGYSENGVQNI